VIALYAAAKEICDWLDARGLRGCLIGGLAVQRWGEPRLTQNVDLTVLAAYGAEKPIVDACLERFSARREDARAFALQHRVVLLRAANEVGLDVVLGAIPFEVECVDRASLYEFEPECVLPTCSAEHLIIQKAVAARPRDLADLDGLVNRQYSKLDLARIRRWLAVFSEIKEGTDVVKPFEDALNRAVAAAERRMKPR
jgi:hypothetical protein